MARNKKGNPIHGWVIVDKPEQLTSTQVVGRVRRAFGAQKVGHGGTLDPFATGVLPIALGEATKTINYALDGVKSYRFTLSLGTATDTGDPTGEIVETSDVIPTEQQIRDILPQFMGEISQIPPKYSALKIDGKRAYDLARAGVDFAIKPRTVTIYDLRLTDCIDNQNYVFDVTVSKGTYIRTLGADMAVALGTVGHLSALRRTAVAHFTEKDTISLEKLQKMGDKDADGFDISKLMDTLMPIQAVLDGIPVLAVNAEMARRLMHGQRLTQADVLGSDFSYISPNPMANLDSTHLTDLPQGSTILVTHPDTTPLALGSWELNSADNGILRTVRLFHLTDAED